MPQARLWVIAIIVGSIFLLSLPTFSQPYTTTASVLDLGMGARPLGMGEAFVGLADDGNAIFYNPAGLAWSQGLNILSSYETRPGIANYGHISGCLSHFGFGMHYFDFGSVPKIDEFGNVLGSFSYRNYILIAGVGVKGSVLPFLGQVPVFRDIAFGVRVKFLRVDTLVPGNGGSFAADLSLLLRSDWPSFAWPFITGYGLGFFLKNFVGLPLRYASGHQENWSKKVVMGFSIELMGRVILATDFANNTGLRLGLEWNPLPGLAVRGGLRNEGVYIWSFGLGVEFANFSLDYAFVAHPHLSDQHRLSFCVVLKSVRIIKL